MQPPTRTAVGLGTFCDNQIPPCSCEQQAVNARKLFCLGSSLRRTPDGLCGRHTPGEVHPSRRAYAQPVPFHGLVVFHGVNATQLVYSVGGRTTLTLIPTGGYYRQSCYKHAETSVGIRLSYLRAKTRGPLRGRAAPTRFTASSFQRVVQTQKRLLYLIALGSIPRLRADGWCPTWPCRERQPHAAWTRRDGARAKGQSEDGDAGPRQREQVPGAKSFGILQSQCHSCKWTRL